MPQGQSKRDGMERFYYNCAPPLREEKPTQA